MIMWADHWENHINDSMTSIYVSQLVRVDISFDVAVLTIETFYSDDWSSYFSWCISREVMSKYDAKLCTWNETCVRGRDRTAESILTLICISTIGAAHATHILACTHTPTQYSWVDDSLTVMTASTTHSSRLETAYLGISMESQPTQVPHSLQ